MRRQLFIPGFLLIFSSMFLFACNSTKSIHSATNKVYYSEMDSLFAVMNTSPVLQNAATPNVSKEFVGTVNFNLRKPNIVVIHHTAQNSCAQTLETFKKRISQVSAHYVICKDGTIYPMLNDYMRAWHAGNGSWGNINDVNSSSIGIELDNDGYTQFDSAQINSLIGLLQQLKTKYRIPQANFIGHSDIAPSRKVDPNIYFPWEKLATQGFGNWYSDTTGLTLPIGFDVKTALRLVGYNVSDYPAAIGAFRRHFLKAESKLELNPSEQIVLYALVKKILDEN